MTPEERFKLDYKKQDDDVRHYSTTRSALTSFLMTVGLTLLAYYFSNSYPRGLWFFPAVGFLILTAAILVCGVFSFRTEKSWLHQRALWEWAKANSSQYPKIKSINPKEVWAEMAKDPMNYALIAVVIAIGIFFFVCNGHSGSDAQSSSAPTIDALAKSAENSSKASAESAKLAGTASNAAIDASRSATESAKSAGAAAEAARAAADQLRKAPPPAGQSPPTIGAQGISGVQRGLLLVGLDPGPIDGKEGRRTKKAAREFSKQAGIPFKGCQDGAFIDALDSRLKK